ncbi:MAG: DNA/RNA helicase domain-containing protein [Candidatus Limisoma sp.]|nr:DUF2075 domain-containing protein [Bacteroidales bacterium]MDY5894517.1 DNA/RNA helicase domain-containing protein [Candidatus Limisoma sp.]
MQNNTHPRCLYRAKLSQFLDTNATEVFGHIVKSFHGIDQTTTNEAWTGEIEILQNVLLPWRDDDAYVFFEYDIPRLGKRIDVVLLLRGIVFCLEFKVGQRDALQADVEQVLDYALDLKNFHLYSEDRPIAPILVPTEYNSSTVVVQPSVYDDAIFNPLISGKNLLQRVISQVLEVGSTDYDPEKWGTNWLIGPYSPTPTIVEAARTLYENHSVEDITRHEADKVSTDRTINCILDVIERSKHNREKSICFVTGVPGAGKTLVGLDVAIKQSYKDGELDKENGAVYLSGNGPLVAVLTEALAVDNYKKCKARGEVKKISDSRREVNEFLQIIHRYRDDMLAKIKNPVENGRLEIDPTKAVELDETGYGQVEHVAIFDEAQRSWTHKRLANYLKRGGTYGNKLKVPNFPVSEASFLIWSLDQRKDWAVIVCLVGGGQEINTGEAGISEWIKALNEDFSHWKIYISNKLTEPEYAEGQVNAMLNGNANVSYSDDLHLAVSLRSFRAETLSSFVHSLLTFKSDAANLYCDVSAKGYPIVLTRSIAAARAWLRAKARGSQQTGILVTKVAARFKPQAVNVLAQGDENAVHWFLEDKTDVRSSNYLEEAATEIQVQGLELDYACVLWDADMRYEDGVWQFYKFNGKNRWNTENNIENRRYMLNAYRVLLTRARQGIVICVPEGNSKLNSEGFPEDATRLPEFYDGTFNYLKSLGIKELT